VLVLVQFVILLTSLYSFPAVEAIVSGFGASEIECRMVSSCSAIRRSDLNSFAGTVPAVADDASTTETATLPASPRIVDVG